MRLPDTNLLVYASHHRSPHYEAAKGWLERYLSSTETVGLAWLAVIGFVRISTNARISADPYSPSESLDIVDGWLAQPATVVMHPGDRHATILRELLEAAGTAGDLTSDAHLAALAIEHNATLTTFDADFHRFSGLKLDYLR